MVSDELTPEEIDRILAVPFTFSRWCRSGVLERCECWRCRQGRGELVTDATNKLSEQQADEVDCERARKTVPE